MYCEDFVHLNEKQGYTLGITTMSGHQLCLGLIVYDWCNLNFMVCSWRCNGIFSVTEIVQVAKYIMTYMDKTLVTVLL